MNAITTQEISFEETVKFHGHCCGGLALGYRMAIVAMQRLEAVRAQNDELVAIVESKVCGVDAIQLVTGCTFGKGNLALRDYGKIACTLFSRKTRKAVRVIPSLLSSRGQKNRRPDMEMTARQWIDWTLFAETDDVLAVHEIPFVVPLRSPVSRVVTCRSCGELVTKSRMRIKNGRRSCIPCLEEEKESKKNGHFECSC